MVKQVLLLLANVRLREAKDDFILPLPEGLSQSEEEFDAQLMQRNNQDSNDFSSTNSANTISNNTNGSAKLSNSFKNAGRTLGSLLKRSNTNSDSEGIGNNSFSDETNTNTDIDFHDIAAAEMASILAPTELDTDDALFPTLSASYKHFPDTATSKNIFDHVENTRNQTSKNTISETGVVSSFDFGHLLTENNQHTELMSRPQNLTSEGESTGRVPVVDSHGRFVAPGEESARALRDEINSDQNDDIQENGAPSLPPSFQPLEQAATLHKQKQNTQNNNTIADAKICGVFQPKLLLSVLFRYSL